MWLKEVCTKVRTVKKQEHPIAIVKPDEVQVQTAKISKTCRKAYKKAKAEIR